MAAPVLHLPLRASRHAALALCAAHALAAAGVLTVGMPSGLAAAGVTALGIHAWLLVRRHARIGGTESLSAAELRGSARVCLVAGDGAREDWEIVGAPLVAPLAVLLTLRRDDGKRRSLWLPRDACPADGHRRLRVVLRWRAGSGPRGRDEV